MNQKLSSKDLNTWLFSHMKFQKGEKMLDLGCGTGKQTHKISNLIGKKGKVCAVDLSKESIKKLSEKSKNTNVNAIVDSFDNIDTILNKLRLNFNTVISTYAIYYSSKPLDVLSKASKYLKPGGKFYITVPTTPHGMINFVSKYTKIPKIVIDSINIGNAVLVPYFKKNFIKIKIYRFNNIIKFTNFNDFFEFYKSTTYYDSKIKNEILRDFEKHINIHKFKKFEKKAILIEATKKFK